MSNPRLLERRSGLDESAFNSDDALQKFCTRRLHTWFAAAGRLRVVLEEPPAGEYGFDAWLVDETGRKLLRLEYKWDRHRLWNMAAEVVAKDRGREPQLGYLLKQSYDWLVYTYVCGTAPVMFLMEAQCARKYIFQFWRDRRFGATHCRNRNRDRTAAWNLLVPVEEMHAFLVQFGMSHRVVLPKTLFDPKTPEVDLAAAGGRDQLLRVLEMVLGTRCRQAWLPSERHWQGLVHHMVERNTKRKGFVAAEIADSRFAELDWLAMGRAQGLIRQTDN